MLRTERPDTERPAIKSKQSGKWSHCAGKHGSDYLYPCTNEVLGTWKHYNLSAQTMNERNTRAKSPLVSRELDRYVSIA